RRVAGRRHPQRRAVGHPGGPRRRAALRGHLQLGLLRPLSVQDRRGLGGRARHARRPDRGPARRRLAGAALERADPPRPRRDGAVDDPGAGDLPWKLYISPEHRPLGYAQYEFFHPTFLYESIWDLVVFLMLVGWLRPRFRGRPGALFFAYIGLYSVGRFAIEALRLDSFWLGSLRVPQLASVA